MTSRRPSLPPLPDLSHLTEEERQIIEGVLMRQKEEEEKNCEIVKNLEKEVKLYEKELDQQNAKLSTVAVESILPNSHNDNQDAGPVCELCCKTKFVDGLGNPCHYCKRKTCARCGGKVTMKPSKFVWACRLCKKKQELLAKTGQWYHGTQANPVGIDIDPMDINQSSSHSGSQNSMANLSNQKSMDHPELQRSFSKDFQRQYSLSEVQSTQRSIPDSNNSQNQQHISDIPKSESYCTINQNVPRQVHKRLPSIPPRSSDYGSGSPMSLPGSEMYQQGRTKDRPEDDYARYNPSYQNEGYEHQRYSKVSESKSSHSDNTRNERHNNFRRSVDQLYDEEKIPDTYRERRKMPEPRVNPQLDNFRYYEHSVSHENIPPKVPPRPSKSAHSGSQRQLPRITPEMMKVSLQTSNPRSQSNQYYMQYPTHSCSPPIRVQSSPRGSRYSPVETYDINPRPSPYSHQTSRQKAHQYYRNDSFSSDVVSEPNIIRVPHHRDVDVDNYTTYSPFTDTIERSSKYSTRYPQQSSFSSSEEDIATSIDCTSCDDRDHDIESISERGYKFKPQFKPSQNQSNYANKQPVSWKLSHDKKKMIKHMILAKTRLENLSSISENGSAILGLKIIGGKVTQSGRLGAFITKVKRGSIADVIGNLLIGDEVLEWNGRSFKNITYEEVNDIILESRYDPEVEIIVRRNLDSPLDSGIQENNKPLSRIPNDGTPKIQLKICYSKSNQHLSVVLVQAINLQPSLIKPVDSLCSSFVKMYLLPDRNEQNYRRSRLFPNSNNPRWNQSFIFSPFKISESSNFDLEVLVFDYDKDSEEADIIGEVIIDLGRANLQDATCWYPLYLSSSEEDSDSGDVSSELMNDSVGSQNQEYWDNSHYDDRTYWDNTPVNIHDNYEHGDYQRKNGKADQRNFRPQYIDRAANYDLGSHIPIPKPINHSSHYQDLKYDTRFQMSEEVTNPSAQNTMRRVLEKPPKNVVANDLSQAYSEEGPRRMNDRKPSDIRPRSKENPPREIESRKVCDEKEGPKSQPIDDAISETSELSENSKNSLRSIQSEQPRKSVAHIKDDDATPRNETSDADKEIALIDTATQPEVSVLRSSRKASSDKNSVRSDGFSSDSGLKDIRTIDSAVVHEASGRKRRPSIGKKFSTVLGFNRKSSSTNNLDKKPRSSFQRSEEVIPAHIRDDKKLSMAYNRNGDGSVNFDSNTDSLNKSGGPGERISRKDGNTIENAKLSASERNESHVETFIEGLGPGQLVGRQVLGMPCLGEIQLSFIDRKGHLEVEVIRARNLVPKNNSKILPQPYIKLHLLEGKLPVEKQRTTASNRKTLDPLYQQPILFSSNFKHKILQISVWGEHGRMEKKSFMGMCDILLDDLKLSSIVFGWYKLFGMTASNLQHHQMANPNTQD